MENGKKEKIVAIDSFLEKIASYGYDNFKLDYSKNDIRNEFNKTKSHLREQYPVSLDGGVFRQYLSCVCGWVDNVSPNSCICESKVDIYKDYLNVLNQYIQQINKCYDNLMNQYMDTINQQIEKNIYRPLKIEIQRLFDELDIDEVVEIQRFSYYPELIFDLDEIDTEIDEIQVDERYRNGISVRWRKEYVEDFIADANTVLNDLIEYAEESLLKTFYDDVFDYVNDSINMLAKNVKKVLKAKKDELLND